FIGRLALKYIVSNAKIIAVRDEETKNYLSKFIQGKNKIISTADVALTLTKEDIPRDSLERIKEKYLNFRGPKIGLHIGANRYSKKEGKKVQLIIDESIQFFNEHRELTPVLIIDNNNEIQNEAVKYIESRIERPCVVYRHYDIWETTALLSELDTVITNKLHIGIVNYAMGNVPISFPYHTKTKRFYKQIDLKQLCVPILDIKKNTT